MQHEDHDHGGEAAAADDLFGDLSQVVKTQAGRLVAASQAGDGFDKRFLDALSALATAITRLASAREAMRDHLAEPRSDDADIDAFFAAIEDRIEERARERAQALVSRSDDGACPACGFALRSADPA